LGLKGVIVKNVEITVNVYVEEEINV